MIAVVDENQLDLFSTAAASPQRQPPAMAASPTAPRDLDDDALIAAIPLAGMLETVALAREVGRRGAATAVPALQAILRRHVGFGARGPAVAEQAAALDALVAIGGPAATQAVSHAIVRGEVQGATLAVAMSAAARLGASFPPDRLADLLGHDDHAIRADACRCARSHATVLARLVELLDDLDPAVHHAAACALGRMGRAEALPVLVRLLGTSPSVEVVEALARIADDDAVVLLGRTARASPDLMQPILEALEGRDDPLALRVAEGLRKDEARGRS